MARRVGDRPTEQPWVTFEHATSRLQVRHSATRRLYGTVPQSTWVYTIAY